MDSLNYLDFELQVERDGGQYRAEVLRSPAGEATTAFSLPFSPESLENLILKLGARRGRSRGVSTAELIAARELGSGLFDAIFTGDVRDCLRRSLDLTESMPLTGLRLKLRLQSVGELADLPWEFLYDSSQGRFIAQSNYTPLVRYIEMPQRIRPLAIELPLRVLVMLASPDDPEYPPLDIEHERRRVEEAFAPLLREGRVEIDWLEKATLTELRNALRTKTYHAFHFIGHGAFDPSAGEGLLVLEDESNRGMRAGAHRIGPLLHDHRSLRLAVLNACEGARNSKDDPFSGIATGLVRQGIPAVVAMQFEITDNAAITFAHGFYAAIARGYPVDMAVAEARSAILVQPNDIEWATPVLYMRAPDGNLFDLPDEIAPFHAAPPDLSGALSRASAQPAPAATPASTPEGSPSAAASPVALRLEAARSGRRRLSRARDYRLTITNREDIARRLALSAHIAAEGFKTTLPASLNLAPGESRSLTFDIDPTRRRWHGRRFNVPFTISADARDGSPPAHIGGVFEDRPAKLLPYAGASVLGVGAVAVLAVLLFGGGGGSPIPPSSPASAGASGSTGGASGTTGGAPAGVATDPDANLDVIFFSSTRGGAGNDIYAISPDGSGLRRLTDDPANDFMPSATLNGKRVAFSSNRSGQDQIYVMNGDGSEQARVTDDHFAHLRPAISPDGRTIAFMRQTSDTYFEVHLATPDGAIPPLTFGGNSDPAWSPDGTRVLVASAMDEKYDIYVVDASGRNRIRLTNGPGDNVQPAWSPGGAQIVFVSTRDGNPEIYLMNADGTNQQQLTFDSANDRSPVWSPDSRRIAFESDRDGNWEVYVMDLETGDLTNVSSHPGEDRRPSWSRVEP